MYFSVIGLIVLPLTHLNSSSSLIWRINETARKNDQYVGSRIQVFFGGVHTDISRAALMTVMIEMSAVYQVRKAYEYFWLSILNTKIFVESTFFSFRHTHRINQTWCKENDKKSVTRTKFCKYLLQKTSLFISLGKTNVTYLLLILRGIFWMTNTIKIVRKKAGHAPKKVFEKGTCKRWCLSCVNGPPKRPTLSENRS